MARFLTYLLVLGALGLLLGGCGGEGGKGPDSKAGNYLIQRATRSLWREIRRPFVSREAVALEEMEVKPGDEVMGLEPAWLLPNNDANPDNDTPEDCCGSYAYLNLLTSMVLGTYDVHPCTGDPRHPGGLLGVIDTNVVAYARQYPDLALLLNVTLYGDYGQPCQPADQGAERSDYAYFLRTEPGGRFQDAAVSGRCLSNLKLLIERGWIDGLVLDLPHLPAEDALLDATVRLLREIDQMLRTLRPGAPVRLYLRTPPLHDRAPRAWRVLLTKLRAAERNREPLLRGLLLRTYVPITDPGRLLRPWSADALRDQDDLLNGWYERLIPEFRMAEPDSAGRWRSYAALGQNSPDTLQMRVNGLERQLRQIPSFSGEQQKVGLWALGYVENEELVWRLVGDQFSRQAGNLFYPILGFVLMFIIIGGLYANYRYWQVRNALARYPRLRLWFFVIELLLGVVMLWCFFWNVELSFFGIEWEARYNVYVAGALVVMVLLLPALRRLLSTLKRAF